MNAHTRNILQRVDTDTLKGQYVIGKTKKTKNATQMSPTLKTLPPGREAVDSRSIKMLSYSPVRPQRRSSVGGSDVEASKEENSWSGGDPHTPPPFTRLFRPLTYVSFSSSTTASALPPPTTPHPHVFSHIPPPPLSLSRGNSSSLPSFPIFPSPSFLPLFFPHLFKV